MKQRKQVEQDPYDQSKRYRNQAKRSRKGRDLSLFPPWQVLKTSIVYEAKEFAKENQRRKVQARLLHRLQQMGAIKISQGVETKEENSPDLDETKPEKGYNNQSTEEE